jgi:hypothetical protein
MDHLTSVYWAPMRLCIRHRHLRDEDSDDLSFTEPLVYTKTKQKKVVWYSVINTTMEAHSGEIFFNTVKMSQIPFSTWYCLGSPAQTLPVLGTTSLLFSPLPTIVGRKGFRRN